MDKYAQNLIKSEPLRKPLLKEIISTLDFPIGSHGLDIGCGIGLQVPLLLQATGERGLVTGMDTSESFLETAKVLAIQTKISKQTNFHSCSWENLPFKSDTFDWAWSIDAVGYSGLESECIFQEIARVVKPGGNIVLAYWSSQTWFGSS